MLQRTALGLLAATFATAVLVAHHGTLINYDRDKQWTSKAVVIEFHYVNPHAQIFFDVKDAKGKVTHYSGELLPNPAQFVRNGWTRKRAVAALQAGTVIKITAAPARAGGTAVLVMRIENQNGEELLGGGPAPGGPEPRPTP
jgi:uncharacterized protein DUF6152